MAVQRWGSWQCLVLLLLASSFSTSDTSSTPKKETCKRSSRQEVMEISSTGTTQVCVVPLLKNTRLKVLHTDTEGGAQEVVVRSKTLIEGTLNIFEIKVQTIDDTKTSLSVRLNGTQQHQKPCIAANPAPQQPRTILLLKGSANITNCTATPEARGREMPWDEEEQTVTQGQEGEEETTSNASLMPSFSTDASFNSTSEETEFVDEDPWWNFLLVLGKVGEVPVLALLLGGVFLGALLGGIVVCFCSKACEKRRVVYEAVPTRRTQSLVTNDFIRDPKYFEMTGERSSGIGSAFSTLTNDNGSHMGTGVRPSESANSSIDRSIRSTTHLSVNNLGRGTTGSPSGSTGREHPSSNNNTLNIPNSGRTRTFSNRSTGSSINRNTNRSPSIPYTKTLGTLTGHQDSSVIQKYNNIHNDDSDSDDSNYDKPYVSRPVVTENYSIPHSTHIVMLERPANTITSDPDKPTDRQVPPSRYETFVK